MNKPLIPIPNIEAAKYRINDVIEKTPLQRNLNLSNQYKSNIYLKREDLQNVRSYKIRGAYNKISSLSKEQLEKGVVCASAGNHAQGVAYSCSLLKTKGQIYMPNPTTAQKINSVKRFGGEYIEVILTGDTFDDAYHEAKKVCEAEKKAFIPPFDDEKIIEGQGTVGLEIYKQLDKKIDYIFVPIGGGGLASGLSSYFKQISPNTKIIGVEPAGAASMKVSIAENKVVRLEKMDTFVDGAAVRQVGNLNFEICKITLDKIITIPEGEICSNILKLYNEEGMIVEPAGALTVSALNHISDDLIGKNIVCVVSGGNNDITRMAEIQERSLMFEELKHYFIVKFPQRSGALKDFLEHVLGKDDDICLFEYTKKTNREYGPALIGVELKRKEDYKPLIERMEHHKFHYQLVNHNLELFNMLI